MTYRHPIYLLLFGLALGIAADLLFYAKLPGISVPLFTALLCGALAAVIAGETAEVNRGNGWIFAPLAFLAVMVCVRANGFLTFLNISAILMLLSLLAIYLTGKNLIDLGLPEELVAPVQALLFSVISGAKATTEVATRAGSDLPESRRRRLGSVARGLALATPILAIFVMLLASADLIFADLLQRLFSLDTWGELIGRSVLVLVVGFLCMGGLAYAVRRRSPNDSDLFPENLRAPNAVGIIETAVVINAVNALFFAFVLVQLPYLFGGQLNIDLDKFTYAEYARRGFAELVVVAVLTLGMIWLLHWLTQRQTRAHLLVFNGSSTVLVGLTTVMLASAFKRLLLYEVAYGFTSLRIYPHVFMIWLAFLLLWFIGALWLRPKRLAFGVLMAAFGFVVTLNLLNPDPFIVRQNVDRMEQNRAGENLPPGTILSALDAEYLTMLSDDAVPALTAVVDDLPRAKFQLVDAHLRARWQAMQEDPTWRRWQSFHFARQRAYAALDRRYAEP